MSTEGYGQWVGSTGRLLPRDLGHHLESSGGIGLLRLVPYDDVVATDLRWHEDQVVVAISSKLNQPQVRLLPVNAVLAFGVGKTPAREVEEGPFHEALLGGRDIPHLELPVVPQNTPVVPCPILIWRPQLSDRDDGVARVFLWLVQGQVEVVCEGNGDVVKGKKRGLGQRRGLGWSHRHAWRFAPLLALLCGRHSTAEQGDPQKSTLKELGPCSPAGR